MLLVPEGKSEKKKSVKTQEMTFRTQTLLSWMLTVDDSEPNGIETQTVV